MFKLITAHSRLPSNAIEQAFLITDSWDDWFEFETLHHLVYFDSMGQRHDVGNIKIGQFGMVKEQRRPDLPGEFVAIGERFFSLGQDDSYYENLTNLGESVRDAILSGLNDVAADLELFERAIHENVTKVSLLRSVKPATVRGQFHRLALGGARLSRFNFSYSAPRRSGADVPPVTLQFAVEPESNPPSNIHVLIGRNGVGKTYLLNNMTRALVENHPNKTYGSFSGEGDTAETPLFANLVSVTFSAFDPFEPLPERRDKTAGTQYSYVGLKRSSNTGSGVGSAKTPMMLANEFVRSLRNCLQGARAARWIRVLDILETDSIFGEAQISDLASEDPRLEVFEKSAVGQFNRLSSGHKIVLLTLTRLVETVEERTLVLLDEPEAHLHPPLLSAFIRALSSLLIDRNGVAIVATHSPVVLQEVPRRCAWKLQRSGLESSVLRPEIETFGENVGVLTREVFGLEVTHAGFHTLLGEAVSELKYFEPVVHRFNSELGAEALAIVRVKTAMNDDGVAKF